MSADCDVLIVGAGVSGLTAAFRLATRGIRTAVIDAATRAGGVIESVQSDGVLHERGPNSILDTSPRINELLDQLGIRGDRIEASALSAQRFVVRAGRLVTLPRSLPAFLGTPLFSTRANFALLRAPFISRATAETED
jgi:oxygen-dependent protoporphyrinogen oxidase